jgi:hypothetical protein
MKKNVLKYSVHLAPLLVAFLLVQVPATTNCATPEALTPATVVAVTAQRTAAADCIKKLFDKNYRKSNYTTIGDLLKQLAIFDLSFNEFPANETINRQELFDHIQDYMNFFTADLQEFFARLTLAEFDVVLREKLAMEEFYNLLTCPINKVPQWPHCVDQVNKFLQGNTLFASLRDDIASVRNTTGWFSKLKIAKTLNKHLNNLPKKIKDAINGMSMSELSNRVKN